MSELLEVIALSRLSDEDPEGETFDLGEDEVEGDDDEGLKEASEDDEEEDDDLEVGEEEEEEDLPADEE